MSKLIAVAAMAVALVMGGGEAANAIYPPSYSSIWINGPFSGTSNSWHHYTVFAADASNVEGEVVTATFSGPVYSGTFDADGVAHLSVKFPSIAGEYTLTFSAFSEALHAPITVGRATSIHHLHATNITSSHSHTSSITGYTARHGRVTLVIEAPIGSGIATVTKTIVASSHNGRFHYTYTKATFIGTYTVTASFVANSHYYGSSSTYVTHFTKSH